MNRRRRIAVLPRYVLSALRAVIRADVKRCEAIAATATPLGVPVDRAKQAAEYTASVKLDRARGRLAKAIRTRALILVPKAGGNHAVKL